MKTLNNGRRLKENIAKVRKYNGQYSVTLPKKLCERSGLNHGDLIIFDAAFPKGFRIKNIILHGQKENIEFR